LRSYECGEAGKGDEVMARVGLDEELLGGAEADGRPEAGDGEGDGAAAVHVAGVAEETHARVCPVFHFHRRRRRR
jgi:hypothetical protein